MKAIGLLTDYYVLCKSPTISDDRCVLCKSPTISDGHSLESHNKLSYLGECLLYV